jgi:cell division protein FtsB
MKIPEFNKKKSIYYIIILILLIYIFFFDNSSFFRKFLIKKQLAELKTNINLLEQENLHLKEVNDKLQNDAKTWEKKARELGMQKEGEEIFLFKSDKDIEYD